MNGNHNVVAGPRVRIIAPTAALASGLLSPTAWAAPGDLDPAFGDVGRVSGLPDLNGTAWAVDSGDNQGILFGGFDSCSDFYDYYYNCYEVGFAGRLNPDGSQDPSFAAMQLSDADVLHLAMQPDGKALGVGSTLAAGSRRLTVFRLLHDGTLDPDFGSDGMVHLQAPVGSSQRGTALALEPDGRLTIAGMRDASLLLARLLPDGTLDGDFGLDGVVVWGDQVDEASAPRIVRLDSGGYRVAVDLLSTISNGERVPVCRVLALTASGELDPTFGNGGVSDAVTTPSVVGSSCSGVAALSDGRVVVGGTAVASGPTALARQGFASRLLPDGLPDPVFEADAVPAMMGSVTALAVGGGNSVVLAGEEPTGLSGALIVRLQADGHLDGVFGRNGATTLQLQSEHDRQQAVVRDLKVLPDSAVVLAGGAQAYWQQRPFVARLLGDAAGGGPGVVGTQAPTAVATETAGTAAIVVRRTGGSTGPVSVHYAALADPPNSDSATSGADFTAVQGRLTWADGDYADREIVIPILADGGPPEPPEQFYVELSEPEGGAGLGAMKAVVQIQGDAYPAGRFLLDVSSRVNELIPHVTIRVHRSDYATGPVSVTLTVTEGSAKAGSDFQPIQPTVLSWSDGEFGTRTVLVPLIDDKRDEEPETILVSLSGATGGAMIGAQSSAAVTLLDNDQGTSGGGRTDGLLWLLGGLGALLRRLRGRR